MIYPGTDRCTRLLYEYQAVPEVTGTCTPGYLKRVLIYTKPEEYIYVRCEEHNTAAAVRLDSSVQLLSGLALSYGTTRTCRLRGYFFFWAIAKNGSSRSILGQKRVGRSMKAANTQFGLT